MFTTILITSVIFLAIALLLFLVVVFNNLQVVKNNITKAESNIKVLLKQRFDEIPQLVTICEKYMGYEAATLKELTTLRTEFDQEFSTKNIQTIDVGKIEGFEGKLNDTLTRLSAVAENYPALRATDQFLHLQKRISDLENQIADRREFFNDSVNTYNIRIESLPDMLIAAVLAYKKKDLLKIEDSETSIPKTF